MTTTKNCMIKPAWTPITIALMVLGFVAFWPLGLAMLAYILWGDRFEGMVRDARAHWRGSQLKESFDHMSKTNFKTQTGNAAFDAYRDRELKRLEEERAKIEAMRSDFDAFLTELRRARDQEEFDRFMANRGKNVGDTGATPL